MSGRSARSIRNFSLELSPDLVLPNVGQVDFHEFRKYWNFNVLEVAIEIFRFVQGLPITPLFFFLRYFKTSFVNSFFCKKKKKDISKCGKDARRQIIEICLVKSASTSVVS